MFQRPLHEVARWPAWEIRLLEHYLAREPAPVEKIEYSIAQLTAVYVNSNLKQGSPTKSTTDYLPYIKAWPEPMTIEEYQQTLKALE